ncbi:ATP-binding protein [Novispirillum sp. DQ9]|uniref:sensor histidine kinase n=1 Tax=Novispirillum sp. DQ9 TaxID=3398612 RepID=UPI003C7D77A1
MAAFLIAVLVVWNGYVTYGGALDDAHDRAEDLAQATERHAVQIVTEARGLLAAAEVAVSGRDLRTLTQDQDLWHVLRALTAAAEAIEALAVIDAHGTILLSTRAFPAPRLTVKDDEDFVAVMASRERLYMSGLRSSPLTGQPQFVMGRRIADGTAAVMVSVDIGRLQSVYRDLGIDGAVFGMYRLDGRLVFQYPFEKPFHSAEAVMSRTDTAVALRRLEGMPIFATVSLGAGPEISQWWATQRISLLTAAVGWLLIIAFTALAIRQLRRERAARQALADANRTLEAAVAERTERLRLAMEQQRRAAALAEAATQAKSRFLTAVGHDMRQPMQALRLYKQSLGLKLQDPTTQQLVARMGDAIGVAEGLLNSAMEIGRIEAGQVVIEPAELPYADLATLLEGQAANGRLRVVPCGAVLWADRVVLGRILGNLVANAIRHGGAGRVLVGCRRADCGGARLMVCDQGPGIPTDKLDAIFEEFYQIENAERSRDKGLGLGLAIARRLALACGYGLSVRSTDHGSTFMVHLPPTAVRSWPVGQLQGRQAS